MNDNYIKRYASEDYVAEEVGKLKEAIADLENKIPSEVGGLTPAQISALDGMFKVAAYTKDVTAEYTAFKAAFGIEDGGTEEPDEPETPDTPTVTLTSISATYSGGDVVVGTALTALTGIVVTATYSDGSTATVTGYALSGEIAEGSNTITVSYGGKTTTFTVTGVDESGGDTGETTGNLLYNWDFTNSLTDSVSGQTATLSGATQDSDGLHIASASDYTLLGDIIGSGNNRTLEVEFGTVEDSGFTGHGRMITMGNSETNFDRGFIYHSTGAWAYYNGTWQDSEETSKTAISGKTLKMAYKSDNTCSVYLDGTLILESVSSKILTYKYIAIGAAANAFYNATIKSVKVYEVV